MKTIIIKLGGSVITYKNSDPPSMNLELMRKISLVLKSSMDKLDIRFIIIHGAGCFGHILANNYEMTSPEWHPGKRDGAVKIRKSMESLNHSIVNCLTEVGLPAISFQTSSSCLLNNKQLVEFPLVLIEKFVNYGLVPVMYGDIAADVKTGIDILSGDQIISYLATKINPDLVLIGSDVDGVFSQDPSINPYAYKISRINSDKIQEITKGLSSSKYIDVTGGMAKKVTELLKIAKLGIPVCIFNAKNEENFEKILAGNENIGTWIYK